ncbi:mycofactocin biosynthesis glycosyltransferase MftF [Nocardioides iriomotensis]|uniref:Mycofactocin system glycosyltransferase n=1 Tax=Nocardioides iriomotensis TaxID=715784 RepID=A0A4Q5J4A0_9ACTN|nr:mycofactocin biosynthesis glycosyltransferase MftF [Nocardioides iriomotensis]RYU13490.1 mycofactocin system glycosyltransferase [Nocardioides iriomotensis]
MTDRPLPPGFRVRLASRTRLAPGGLLVGGHGGGVVRLRGCAPAVVAPRAGWTADGSVGSTLGRALLDAGFADPAFSGPAGADAAVTGTTVVVPVRDDAGRLAALLAALPAGVPVVVVDDGSRQPDAVAAVAAEHGARLLVHERNRGPAAARNTGLRHVATPLVAFCDADVVPDPGWLAILRRHLDDPAVGLVGPRVLGQRPRPADTWIDRYEQARSSLDLGRVGGPVRPQWPVAYLPSACLLARVAALGDGFDERMHVAEDVDLVWRLDGEGWRVRYEPAATVRHDHRTRPAAWLGRKAFYGSGAADLAARHGSRVAPAVLTPWTVALTVALLAQRRWSLPLAAAALGAATAGLHRRLGDAPVATAAGLALQGGYAAVRQVAPALTRHYWPVALPLALVSRRARRAWLVAAVVDGLLDHAKVRPDLDPVRYTVARRLDDLAYGAGLWRGAWRARSARALLPDLRLRRRVNA